MTVGFVKLKNSVKRSDCTQIGSLKFAYIRFFL